jgi:predicted phage terminase large subunit-like protein
MTDKDRLVRLSAAQPYQQLILQSPARNKVVLCGRRWGKTHLGMTAAILGHGPTRTERRGALDGGKILWLMPTMDMATGLWSGLKEALRGAWTRKSETERRITLLNYGEITVKSSENPDVLRGPSYDGVVFDELKDHDPAAWESVRPTLSDRQGWILFLGTPGSRDNWVYSLFEKAGREEGWARWQRPSSDNPLMTEQELASARADVGSVVFAREYLAQFVVLEGGMFKESWLKFYDGHDGRYVLGNDAFSLDQLDRFSTVDLAATTKTYSDYTVVASWGATPDKRLVLLDVVRRKLEGPDIIPVIQSAIERWKLSLVWIESGGFQSSLITDARRRGLPIRELRPDKDKITRAEPATAALEGGRVWFPRHAPWLSDFTSEVLAFPDPHSHDDQVDALAYAVNVVRESSRGTTKMTPEQMADFFSWRKRYPQLNADARVFKWEGSIFAPGASPFMPSMGNPFGFPPPPLMTRDQIERR